MATSFLSMNLFLMMLVGAHPIMVPAQLAAGAVAGVKARYDMTPAPTSGADDVVLLQLFDVDGLKARGLLLACRTDGKWAAGTSCPASLVTGRELRVFTGSGGEAGRWKAAGAADKTVPGVVAGELTVPLADADPTDPLRVPFALLGESRHLVEPPDTQGYGADELTALLELGKRVVRMNRRMGAGMKPAQYAVTNLSSNHRGVVVVSGSTWPEGPLDKAPLPSASLLFVHDPDHGSGDWARSVFVQVISKPDDVRKFERYGLAAVLDVDGDGERELLVRGRSALGDRFRLFQLPTDELRFQPVTGWAGVVQPDSAPTSPKQ